ncbi:D-serine deaminase-like pyridoxal phosphate-dependent protein [Melghirimyces profundicolus]|uniref:D-serine deaminase-like pyridoxal phosphate-dependent protein n=1 Tax=Melghirimyces profundicolus TaxID=1242148 RepID=A0A2T6BCT7_9BACL|nr:amino acid deaminase/aldolase [Melghirimyces profundicolus]PTX53885.1 D-serine deaminase-like pyridoxal phosphate-dependent protein [Melghirimyces profundicolus]
MSQPSYTDYKRWSSRLSKPFAYLDLDLLEENMRKIREAGGGKRIRLASKSLRSVPVIRYILDSGDPFRGVMCYAAEEALFLAQRGLDDLLVAYPVWDAGAIRAVAAVVKKGASLTLMVDCPEHVDRIAAVAREEGTVLPVCLDMDLSVSFPGLHFGVHRSPLSSQEDFLRVADHIRQSEHVRLDGVMGYEAQVAGVGDRVPGQPLKNGLVRLLKRHSVRRTARLRKEWVSALRNRGHQLRFINGGGTGSLRETAMEETVTEVTVGSGFYAPLLFDHYRSFRYRPAAGFALAVTRKPKPGLYTCSGGGFVASGAAGPDKLPRPALPEGARLTPLEGAGEVQTPVRWEGSPELELGDPIFFRHAKAGELCEHFRELIVVSGRNVVDRFPTYRGEGRCFL